jgi:inner membrane protein
MAGTVVHMAFSGLLAAALLGAAFDMRSLLIVVAVTALADLDAFVAIVSTAGHRAVLHNFVLPAGAAALLWLDTRRPDSSVVRGRWGAYGVRVAWVTIVAYAASAVALDFVSGTINPLWPIHDQYYVLEGKIELSDQRGIIQTFIELGKDGTPKAQGLGSTADIELSTGVNPDPEGTETDPERIFPIVRSGWQLVLLVVGTAVTLARFRVSESISSNPEE